MPNPTTPRRTVHAPPSERKPRDRWSIPASFFRAHSISAMTKCAAQCESSEGRANDLEALRQDLMSDFREALSAALHRHEVNMQSFISRNMEPPLPAMPTPAHWSEGSGNGNGNHGSVALGPALGPALGNGNSNGNGPVSADSSAQPPRRSKVNASSAEPAVAKPSSAKELWNYDLDDERFDAPPDAVIVSGMRLGGGGAFDVKAPPPEELGQVEYDVMDFYKETGIFQKVAKSDCFSNVTLAIIAANGIYLGIDAHFNTASSLLDAKLPFFLSEQFFCTYFTWEIVVRFGAFKLTSSAFKDSWFVFDSALVSMMVAETWLVPLLSQLVGLDVTSLPTAPLKILRLLRLSRLVRLMRSLPELVTMVKGMRIASRAVASSLLMIAILIYVFAIILHMLVAKDGVEQFSTLPWCMWTLLLDGTFMDSTGARLTALIEDATVNTVAAAVFLLLFILLSAMTVMNMLIGILCEVVSAVAEQERDEAALSLIKKTVLTELRTFDTDASGTINGEELDTVLECPRAIAVLKGLEVDVPLLVLMRHKLLPKSTSEMKIEHVIDLILSFRGGQPASVKHIVEVLQLIRWFLATGLQSLDERVLGKIEVVQSEMIRMERRFESKLAGVERGIYTPLDAIQAHMQQALLPAERERTDSVGAPKARIQQGRDSRESTDDAAWFTEPEAKAQETLLPTRTGSKISSPGMEALTNQDMLPTGKAVSGSGTEAIILPL